MKKDKAKVGKDVTSTQEVQVDENRDQAQLQGKRRRHRWVFIPIGIVAALVVAYLGCSAYFHGHFCPGTTIGEFAVGGKDVDEVESLIRAEIEDYSMTLMEREGMEETIEGASFGITPVFNGEIDKMLEEQNCFAWPVKLVNPDEFELDKAVSYDEDALREVIDALSCMQAENERTPVDATWSSYIEGTGYELVPADYGTTIMPTALYNAVAVTVDSLASTLDLDAAGCYLEPDVGDDDEDLLALIDELNSYVGMTITYDFDDERETLDGTTVNEWLIVDDDWNVTVDEDMALDFVKSLASKYNTAYHAKELETSYGVTVTITNGFYGWKIDNSGELDQLLADLEAGEDVEREPVYSQTANSHGENDYGDSYVEINLTAQHLFLYKDGNLVLDTDFVSGKVSNGNATPVGAYGITYKTMNAVLRGEGYETPVTYWMPFNGNVGMHDATWRYSFGGSIYLTNGSHGCINLPYSMAEQIYAVVEKGYPVLVYELPGTETDAVKQAEASQTIAAIDAIGEVTLESETAINTARNLYNSLSSYVTPYVTNYDTLVAAENALAGLKAAAGQ